MPSTPPSSRPADLVNAEIRALLERTRRQLSDVERAEYEVLLQKYTAAIRDEVATAA